MFATHIFFLALQCLSLTVLGAPKDFRSEAHPHDSDYEGGPHGDIWSDQPYIGAHHKRIAHIKLIGCGPDDHIAGISIGYRDNFAKGMTVTATSLHGGKKSSGVVAELPLGVNEYITRVTTRTFQEQVHFYYYSLHTRIGHVVIETNKQQKISCGKFLKTDPIKVHEVVDGAVLYFSGRAGDALDGLQAHWIPKTEF